MERARPPRRRCGFAGGCQPEVFPRCKPGSEFDGAGFDHFLHSRSAPDRELRGVGAGFECEQRCGATGKRGAGCRVTNAEARACGAELAPEQAARAVARDDEAGGLERIA